MKLKQDLLERVRKGELIVDNDNSCVIRELWPNTLGISRYYVQYNDHTFKYKCTGILTDSKLFLGQIIKASELIEKEDYTKPLQEGIDCIFFNHNESFVKSLYQHYDTSFSREFCHYDKRGAAYKYCFEITGEETINEIQEKINSLLKDK